MSQAILRHKFIRHTPGVTAVTNFPELHQLDWLGEAACRFAIPPGEPVAALHPCFTKLLAPRFLELTPTSLKSKSTSRASSAMKITFTPWVCPMLPFARAATASVLHYEIAGTTSRLLTSPLISHPPT